MNISPTTKKKIDDRDRLVKKHEREIEEQTGEIIKLNNELEKKEAEIENEFKDIYKSKHYKKIWGDLEVNEVMARNTILNQVFEKEISYINNRINIANMLLNQANEKRLKRIDEIKKLLPKKTKSANFRQFSKKSRSRSKGGRKRKKTKRRC